MEKCAFFMCRVSNVRQRLNGSYFVLAVQYGDDERPFRNSLANRFGINPTMLIDANCCHRKSAV